MKYVEVINKIYGENLTGVPPLLLCIDPGETTGYAVFEKAKLASYGQIETITSDGEPRWTYLHKLFRDIKPSHVVCEDYRVYGHKLERHANSKVVTLRLIGGLDFMCWNDERSPNETLLSVPIHYQMAAQAKGFVTDQRLKDWGFWKEGMKHSRDAIRHGIYFLVITNKPKGD